MNLGGRTSCYLSVLLITSKLQSSKYPLCDHHLISTATGCYKFAHKLYYIILFISFGPLKLYHHQNLQALSSFLTLSPSLPPSQGFAAVAGHSGPGTRDWWTTSSQKTQRSDVTSHFFFFLIFPVYYWQLCLPFLKASAVLRKTMFGCEKAHFIRNFTRDFICLCFIE